MHALTPLFFILYALYKIKFIFNRRSFECNTRSFGFFILVILVISPLVVVLIGLINQFFFGTAAMVCRK
jgi:hypothetical protein